MNIPIYYTDRGKFILAHIKGYCTKCSIRNICSDHLLNGMYFNGALACIDLYNKIDNRLYKLTFKPNWIAIVHASLFITSYEKRYGHKTLS